jgi:hypothetical protein
MPNATVRANARSTPKPKPKRTAAPSALTAATIALESSVAVLTKLKAAEPPCAGEHSYPELDNEINEVVIWTSLATFLSSEMHLPKEMSESDRRICEQLDAVLEKAEEAARALRDKYLLGEEVEQ